ncbi:MAG: hypothetical protein NTW87_02515 [Planctomycetota bacterium]|nr:hypothetical protein [Planctomycetota bacterium]
MDYFEQAMQILNRWAGLGTHTVKSNGARLIGRVPHLGPEAWFHFVFKGLDVTGISELERHAERAIPAALRQFYSRSNGMILFSDSFAIYGLRRDYIREGDHVFQPFDIDASNTFERPKDASDTMLFIGSYSYDGSRLYLSSDDPRVFRCARRTVVPLNRWPTFEEMIVAECERLSRLFDVRGRKLDPSAATTPAPDVL